MDHDEPPVRIPRTGTDNGEQTPARGPVPLVASLQQVRGNRAIGRHLNAQRALAPDVDQDEAAPSVHDVVGRGGGHQLDPAALADLEVALGHDFSDVRVHVGGVADASARGLRAKAYTVGNEIVFAEGHYQPGTTDGRRTLAHELTHVIQQRQGAVAGTDIGDGVSLSDPGDPFERAAVEAADRITHGGASVVPAETSSGTAPTPAAGAAPGSAPVQREEEEGWFAKLTKDPLGTAGQLLKSGAESVVGKETVDRVLSDDTATSIGGGSQGDRGQEATGLLGAVGGIAGDLMTKGPSLEMLDHGVDAVLGPEQRRFVSDQFTLTSGVVDQAIGGVEGLMEPLMSKEQRRANARWLGDQVHGVDKNIDAFEAFGADLGDDADRAQPGRGSVLREGSGFVGGFAKGATGLVGGLGGAILNPTDAARGMKGLFESSAASKVMQGESFQQAAEDGQLAPTVFKPFTTSLDEGKGGEFAGRVGFEVALAILGGGAASELGEVGEAAGAGGRATSEAGEAAGAAGRAARVGGEAAEAAETAASGTRGSSSVNGVARTLGGGGDLADAGGAASRSGGGRFGSTIDVALFTEEEFEALKSAEAVGDTGTREAIIEQARQRAILQGELGPFGDPGPPGIRDAPPTLRDPRLGQTQPLAPPLDEVPLSESELRGPGQLTDDVVPSRSTGSSTAADRTATVRRGEDLLRENLSLDEARRAVNEMRASGNELGARRVEGAIQDALNKKIIEIDLSGNEIRRNAPPKVPEQFGPADPRGIKTAGDLIAREMSFRDAIQLRDGLAAQGRTAQAAGVDRAIQEALAIEFFRPEDLLTNPGTAPAARSVPAAPLADPVDPAGVTELDRIAVRPLDAEGRLPLRPGRNPLKEQVAPVLPEDVSEAEAIAIAQQALAAKKATELFQAIF